MLQFFEPRVTVSNVVIMSEVTQSLELYTSTDVGSVAKYFQDRD